MHDNRWYGAPFMKILDCFHHRIITHDQASVDMAHENGLTYQKLGKSLHALQIMKDI